MRPLDPWHVAIMNVHRDDAFSRRWASRAPARKDRSARRSSQACGRSRRISTGRCRVTLRLREMEARASALVEMTDRALVALVLTDASGRIAEANGFARTTHVENDRLGSCATGGCAPREVRIAFGFRGSPGSNGIAPYADERRHAGLAPSRGRRPLALVVSPTRDGAPGFGRSHAVSIAFADPERAPEADANLLARPMNSPAAKRPWRRFCCKAVRRGRPPPSSR